MQREFLQEKSINRMNDNAEKSVNVDLSAKSRLIPFSDAAGMLSLNNLYTEERDTCETYRMIFTVNPICSNVLYNSVTEPVYMEGSESAITLVETPISRIGDMFNEIFQNGTINLSGDVIDRVFAVKDTEISSEKIGGFKYHCGYDIFNNHLLRTKEFEHVMKADSGNEDVFNTIEDYAVDYNGKIVERVIGESTGPFIHTNPADQREKIRMYGLDDIESMNTAFYYGLKTVDGWYGFYNSGYIDIPNTTIDRDDIYINRVLNNETPCAFVDFYPDRSLFSFIPKVNRFRKRIERNWDCTVVYPCSSDIAKFNEINENEANAVKVVAANLVYNNAGDEQIQMVSLLRHTLTPGDQIRLFYSGTSEELTRYSVPVTVIGVGNEDGEELNRYFKIRVSDIKTFCKVYENRYTGKKYLAFIDDPEPIEGDIRFFYRKVESGCDDKYYLRKFRTFKNCKYIQVDDVPSGVKVVEMKKEPTVVNEFSPEYIKIDEEYFRLDVKPLMYSQNKIAFAGNIYGDRVAQVIFSDDICTSGLKDNLGRPLTSVYFMAVKTNRGYKEWYEEGNASADTVEYSHCFGEVTSGLDLPSGVTDYNVRSLHNVYIDECADQDNKGYRNGLEIIMEEAPTGKGRFNTPMCLESAITIDGDGYNEEFYGDVVEFSRANYIETPIENVYYRFNTAQRECVTNVNYFDIHYDDLVGDIYDVGETEPGPEPPGPGPGPEPPGEPSFTIKNTSSIYSVYGLEWTTSPTTTLPASITTGETNIISLAEPFSITKVFCVLVCGTATGKNVYLIDTTTGFMFNLYEKEEYPGIYEGTGIINVDDGSAIEIRIF